jgi:hypothetical protein
LCAAVAISPSTFLVAAQLTPLAAMNARSMLFERPIDPA